MNRENPQIYIGDLSRRIDEEDILRKFSRFGKIRTVNIKIAFAFVEFYEFDSALQAIK